MTYGEEAVLFPVADLYDQGAMQAYIAAAKDQYDRGQKAMDDFISKYGDFTSPIAEDVEYWDNNTMKPIIDMYDEFTRNGIDPARSPEARNALMARARRLPYAQLAAVRQSAETAKQFNTAMQKLITEGKYNPAYRKYDADPSTWRTISDDGSINIFNTPSPTVFQDLTAFSNPWYANLKPTKRTVSKNGVTKTEESITMDDINDVAYINAEAMLQTPQGSRMYRKMYDDLIQAGYSSEDAEDGALDKFIKAIANSQVSRLTNNSTYDDHHFDRERLELAQNADARAERADGRAERAQQFNERIAEYNAQTNRIRAIRAGGGTGSRAGSKMMSDVFQYGEATQEAGIGRFTEKMVGQVEKLKRNEDGSLMTDSKGNPVVEVDKNGKPIMLSVQDASLDEVQHAFYKHGFGKFKQFTTALKTKYKGQQTTRDNPDAGPMGRTAFNEFLNTFGYNDSTVGWEASMGNKVNSEGKVKYSAGDYNNLYTDQELMMMTKGLYKSNNDHDANIKWALYSNTGADPTDTTMKILKGSDGSGIVEPLRSGPNSPNKIMIPMKDGRFQMFRAVNINFGNSTNVFNTGRLWIPVGSPTMGPVTGKNASGQSTMAFNPYVDELDSMSQVQENARFSQATGSQKQQNISLGTPAETSDEYLIQDYLNNQLGFE